MKVLINGYVGSKITGIGKTLIETIKSVVEQDNSIRIIIITNFNNYEIIELGKFHNVKIVTYKIKKESSFINLLFNMFIFPLYTVYYNVNIVYYPNFILIPFKFRKTIVVIHDLIEFKVKSKFSKTRTLYRKIAVPRMAKISDTIITVSNNSKRDIVETFNINQEKIRVIYNGVSKVEKTITKNPEKHVPYILYLGTVDYPGKNIMNSIKAFELLKEDYCDNIEINKLEFVIAGMKGNNFEVIENYISLSKYKDDITYLGYVDENTKYILLNNAILLVFASYYEGFGLPIIEANMHGTAVVTSTSSCLPEIANNAALIVDPDSIDLIKTAYYNIISNEELRNKLISNGFENANRFSWTKTGKATLSVFKEVCEL